MKKLKTKIKMLRRNDPVIKSVESVLKPGRESMAGKVCERAGSERQRDFMDGDSGELTGS